MADAQPLPDLTIRFHGASGTVTGSCFEISGAGRTILVDCGMFQGTRSLEKVNYEPLPFAAKKLDAVVLTHAHLDHSGRLPCLELAGSKAPIYCTRATAEIIKPLLMDSAKLAAAAAERRNRRADRAGMEPFVPLYTGATISSLMKNIQVIDFCETVELGNGVSLRLWDARHIVGSASVEIGIAGQRLLVSGDIGSGTVAGCDGIDAGGFDHVICESTYGDRVRDDLLISDRREVLAKHTEETIQSGGNLLLPAFAVERTQTLLEDYAALFDAGRLAPVQIFLDSPLAQKITMATLKYRDGGGDILKRSNIRFIQSVTESKKLNRISGAVIIAGSGMCEGGRIRHHLIRNLPRRQSKLLFTGFQVAGTLGSVLSKRPRAVRISGNDVPVRASIASLEGYSNHADRNGLSEWLRNRAPISGSIFLVHGEQSSLDQLASDVRADSRLADPVIPALGEKWALHSGAPAQRIEAARSDAEQLVAPRDWTSRLAELRSNVEQRVRDLPSDKDRERLLEGLQRALEAQ